MNAMTEHNTLTPNELQFVDAVMSEIERKTKHNKKSIEKLAQNYKLTNPNQIKELTELAIVKSARQSVARNSDDRTAYDEIVELYKNQVNLSQRTSHSMLLQQYSTPAPIAFLAGLFIRKQGGDYFEPSAGNGLLTIALPYPQTTVNEIDDIRLQNLNNQPFAEILSQNATLPFPDFYKKFDGIVTNPPFGTLDEPIMFDGFKINTLDHLMALRALDCMKDDGKAAIIIGGHTTWDEHGRIQAGKNRIFFNYLYAHYFVEDVILIDGHKLYSRQGTSFDVRLILIAGRKPKTEGFAPLKNETMSKIVDDFEDLWERVSGFEEQVEVHEKYEFTKLSQSEIEDYLSTIPKPKRGMTYS